MDFQLKTTSITSQRSACAVVPVFEGTNSGGIATAVDKACGGLIKALRKRGDMTGQSGQQLLLPQISGIAAQQLLLVGCGKRNDMSVQTFVKLMNGVAAKLKACGASDASLFFEELYIEERDSAWIAQQAAKILTASTYNYDAFKSKKRPAAKLKKVFVHHDQRGDHKALKIALGMGRAVAMGMASARDLGNAPGNLCTPTYMANQAKSLARKHKALTTKIIDEKQMKEMGMGALLSVSAGSDEPAKLIVMEYKGGPKTQKPVVLLGKGITFDTGGISLKPGGGMDEMKFDMCGAASVFGTLTAILELALPINVVFMVTSAENMPSGRATKPGDIVTTMSGQTVEILNTDAEGRLVLCDALTYAERFKPRAVIDVATLTGACVVALGKHATGLYSNQDELAASLLEAGEKAYDRAWRMPLWDEYQPQLDSNFADMANIGGPQGGSVTAACFLSRFTKKFQWAHLDIAGTAWLSGASKGATGRPVPLLTNYLATLAKRNH